MIKRLMPVLAFALLFMFGCSGNQQQENQTENSTSEETTTSDVKTEEDTEVELEGYDTIEELAASVVKSLKEEDYESYYTHIMSEEMELAQAKQIEDSIIRKEFLHEYGFSLHEEKEYFDNLIHFYTSKNVNLDKVVLEDMEYTEYKGGEYHPLELYEVFVPIEMDYEMLIDFTVIKVDGQYFLTSELGM